MLYGVNILILKELNKFNFPFFKLVELLLRTVVHRHRDCLGSCQIIDQTYRLERPPYEMILVKTILARIIDRPKQAAKFNC